mmetsp:Transcript_2192/g.2970  ORF Transcript_2192/g.2970 Transcript_2192/m.2970 type:complete len:257 (-) Transcript_2192:1891-2661(-)
MNFVIPQKSLPILNQTKRFPVNRVYCIGRNYREHAIEMGHDPEREPPFFFQKPFDAVVDTTCACTSAMSTLQLDSQNKKCIIPYPPMTKSLHYEGELIIAIGKEGINISEKDAKSHIFGYAIGCDLTRRDLQSQAKKLSRPWDISKGFDYSAPMSQIVSTQDNNNNQDENHLLPDNAKIQLSVNGQTKQNSTIDHMIWSIPEMISFLSQYFRLKPGDLIMTGTPAGVGELNVGDEVQIQCGNLPICEFQIGEPESS